METYHRLPKFPFPFSTCLVICPLSSFRPSCSGTVLSLSFSPELSTAWRYPPASGHCQPLDHHQPPTACVGVADGVDIKEWQVVRKGGSRQGKLKQLLGTPLIPQAQLWAFSASPQQPSHPPLSAHPLPLQVLKDTAPSSPSLLHSDSFPSASRRVQLFTLDRLLWAHFSTASPLCKTHFLPSFPSQCSDNRRQPAPSSARALLTALLQKLLPSQTGRLCPSWHPTFLFPTPVCLPCLASALHFSHLLYRHLALAAAWLDPSRAGRFHIFPDPIPPVSPSARSLMPFHCLQDNSRTAWLLPLKLNSVSPALTKTESS